MNPRTLIVALLSGLIFGTGLVFSGMTQPTKVIGFLDVLGGWDPTLAFVLAGATGTHMALRPLLQRLVPEQVAAGTPSSTAVDPKLLTGAALFGIGWGLGGYCPGPAVTAVLPALKTTMLFVGPMLVGMGLHRAFTAMQTPDAPTPETSSAS